MMNDGFSTEETPGCPTPPQVSLKVKIDESYTTNWWHQTKRSITTAATTATTATLQKKMKT